MTFDVWPPLCCISGSGRCRGRRRRRGTLTSTTTTAVVTTSTASSEASSTTSSPGVLDRRHHLLDSSNDRVGFRSVYGAEGVVEGFLLGFRRII